MITIMLSAILGGVITFVAWESHGIIPALILAPFGGSAAGAIISLAISAKNPE